MCGIAGLFHFGKQKKKVCQKQLTDMALAMRHRGPDQWGLYLDDLAGLAHCRLSIIDVEGGAQPIHNEDKTLWIVYNGEI